MTDRIIAARILRQMGVPRDYQDKSFHNYDVAFNQHASAVNELRQIAQDRRWALICSANEKRPTGIGRSHLGVAMLGLSWWNDTYYQNWDEMSIEHYNPELYRFIDVRVDGLRIKQAGIALPGMLDNWMRKRLLLFDDLGCEPNEAIPVMNALINHAYGERRQVIITTSLTVEEFRADNHYGKAIFDRVKQRGGIVGLTGRSHR